MCKVKKLYSQFGLISAKNVKRGARTCGINFFRYIILSQKHGKNLPKKIDPTSAFHFSHFGENETELLI